MTARRSRRGAQFAPLSHAQPILPVLGMCLLGLVTLLLPALVVLAPVLLVTPVWWLLASNRDRSAPAGVTTGAGAASLAPVLQRSVR